MKRFFRHLPMLLVLRFGRKFNVEGINLVIPMQKRDRVELLRTAMAGALRLIYEVAPKHYARIQKFMPNILILGAHPYAATYNSDLKLCDISMDYAISEGTTVSHIAMTLVHEAAHGYIESRGITYDEPRRAQIERICVLQEVAFARKLPDSADLVAQAESYLSIGPEYWKKEAFHDRDVEGVKNQLKSGGIPDWVVKRLIRFGEYIRARRMRKK
jgi:hypothetical protein